MLQRLRQQEERTFFSQFQYLFAVLLLIGAAVIAGVLVRDAAQLQQDITDPITGDEFKILGEVSNLQRSVLRTLVEVNHLLREDGSGDVQQFDRLYAFARIDARTLYNRDEGYTERGRELVDQIWRGLDQLEQRVDMVTAEQPPSTAEMRPLLLEAEAILTGMEQQVNALYVEQEAYRVLWLQNLTATTRRSQLLLSSSGIGLLLLSGTILYVSGRSVRVQRKANERFRMAAAAVGSAIHDWNIVDDLVVWTPGLWDVFGYDTDRIEPTMSWWREQIHPEDRSAVVDLLDHALQKSRIFAAEYRMKRSDGQYLDVSHRGQIVRNTAGRAVRMVGNLEDITEQRQIVALQEANRAKTRLLAHVSHELHTPLNAIIGFVEILQAGIDGPINDKQNYYLSRTLVNARYLLELIDNLLNRSRLEEGQLMVRYDRFALADLVESAESAAGVALREKDVTFEVEVDAALPDELVGDVRQLRQIIINLVSNATKFTTAGEVRLRLKRPQEDKWTIEVGDTGPGIAQTEQEHIFESFYRLEEDERGATTGFGLGLSIVQQIVKLMDGEIQLQSKIGEGSTFTVTLPLLISEGETI